MIFYAHLSLGITGLTQSLPYVHSIPCSSRPSIYQENLKPHWIQLWDNSRAHRWAVPHGWRKHEPRWLVTFWYPWPLSGLPVLSSYYILLIHSSSNLPCDYFICSLASTNLHNNPFFSLSTKDFVCSSNEKMETTRIPMTSLPTFTIYSHKCTYILPTFLPYVEEPSHQFCLDPSHFPGQL